MNWKSSVKPNIVPDTTPHFGALQEIIVIDIQLLNLLNKL